MTTIQRIILSLLLMMGCSFMEAFAQESNKAGAAVYGFAYSTNLNDSTSYVSAISTLPEASVDKKTHFLNNRSAFAHQFKTYVEANFKPKQTCVVFFSLSRKQLENQYVKLRRSMQKRKGFKMVELDSQAFKFAPIKEE